MLFMTHHPTKTQFFEFPDETLPFELHRGGRLSEVTLSYETYGELNDTKDNAVLVFHALTGSQHAMGWTDSVPGVSRWNETCQLGWWDKFVGPKKAVNTEKLFVICVNYLGGCYGSTGPQAVNPDTGEQYGGSFPKLRIIDIVNSQLVLLDALGITQLHGVTGASVGGLASLVLAAKYPDRVKNVIPISSGLRTTPLQFLNNFEQVAAILNDPDFNGGDYYRGSPPDKGMALARMIGHKTFVSLEAMADRAGEQVDKTGGPAGYTITHPLESYIWRQGQSFLGRFDANSYVRLMGVWQHFDFLQEVGADSFQEAFERCTDQKYTVFSIDSDVCFYPPEQTDLMTALKSAGVTSRRITVHSEKGHDSFLLEPELFKPFLIDALSATLRR
jgi:homoserine O-acetyltransferase